MLARDKAKLVCSRISAPRMGGDDSDNSGGAFVGENGTEFYMGIIGKTVRDAIESTYAQISI